MSKMLKVSEIAKQLNVSPRTVNRWIDDKRLPAYQFGTEYRIDETDFMNFVTKSKTIKDEDK